MSLRHLLPVASIVALHAITPSAASGGETFNPFKDFWNGPRKPMLDFTFSSGPVKQRLFQSDLSGLNTLELKLGYFRARPIERMVAHLDDKFISLSYSGSDQFGRTLSPGKVGTTLLRFGTGTRSGYAYDFTTSFLYPYHQSGLLWTKLASHRTPGLSVPDAAILERYEGSFRFGYSTEGGLAFGLGDVISVHVGYEAAVVYPRHVFWPWLGSVAISGAGTELLSHFTKDIIESSPAIGPFLHAILRSGFAYAYYLAVRDNQYWPFASETPLTSEALKCGITLTF